MNIRFVRIKIVQIPRVAWDIATLHNLQRARIEFERKEKFSRASERERESSFYDRRPIGIDSIHDENEGNVSVNVSLCEHEREFTDSWCSQVESAVSIIRIRIDCLTDFPSDRREEVRWHDATRRDASIRTDRDTSPRLSPMPHRRSANNLRLVLSPKAPLTRRTISQQPNLPT